MKTIRQSFLLSLLVFLGLVSLVCAASMPALDVKVSNSAGKAVFTGKTDSSGNFTTGELTPGTYVVKFNGNIKGGPYALQIRVGKEENNADSLPAGKFGKGGLAMKITVAAPMNVTGQIAPAGTIKTAAATVPTKTAKGLKTKMINGRECVWIPPEQGGWLPGKWVPADSIEARNAEANRPTKPGK